MRERGFLEAIEVTRQGARPERTVYRITDDGHRELVAWARQLIAVPQPAHTRFVAGLSVLAVLRLQDAAELLRQRADRLTDSLRARRTALAEAAAELPRLFLVEEEYRIAMTEAEARWTRSLPDELSAATFPQQDTWHQWHENG